METPPLPPPNNAPPALHAKPWYRISLTSQILLGLILGGLVGWLKPDWGVETAFIRDIFLNLIKSIIAPLMFSSIVGGIAGGGDLRKVGRIGVKALVYFEIVTTLALFIGLAVVNIVRPGVGVVLQADTSSLGQIAQSHPLTMQEILVHIFPSSIVDAMAHGEVLQIVAFSVIFGISVAAIGKKGEPVLVLCDSITQVMFKFTGYVMKVAPFGVAAAIAATVGHKGLGVLINLGLLIASLYVALIIFVLLVLGSIAVLIRVPLKQFVQAVREPFAIAFATSSGEAALPKSLEVMERFGVPKRTVGFVIPTGYSFNLDGSTLYLAVASVFIAQAAEGTTGIHFGIGQQMLLMLTLIVTSKGVAAVSRAALVVLLAAVYSFGLPAEGVAVILGVDAIMDMARTSVNVLGNCMACVVVARWEGEFDDNRARVFGTAEELALDGV
jgi:proton glutamate symport protein